MTPGRGLSSSRGSTPDRSFPRTAHSGLDRVVCGRTAAVTSDPRMGDAGLAADGAGDDVGER